MTITYNDLITRAQEVRDESEIGGNTAQRVGQLLADIIQWCNENNADIGAYISHFAALLNGEDGILNWWQSRFVALATMGSYYDDVDISTLSNGDLYYNFDTKKVVERYNGGGINVHIPSNGVIYLNLATGRTYQWDGTNMVGTPTSKDIINLRQNVELLLSSIGNYAFPDGKPTLDWEGTPELPTYSVTYPTDPRVTHSGAGDTVELGSSLEVTLGTDDNLYVIDDDSVVVKMGGVILQGAYSSATGNVTIAEVTDVVEITAAAITYVSTNLTFHLDCKNRGGSTGHWIDLIGSKDFALSNVTEADTGMVFNGTSSTAICNGTAQAPNSVDVSYTAGTIEFVVGSGLTTSTKMSILQNCNSPSGISAIGRNAEAIVQGIASICTCYKETGSVSDSLSLLCDTVPQAASLNINDNGTRVCLVSGVVAPQGSQQGDTIIGASSWGAGDGAAFGKMAIGCYLSAATGNPEVYTAMTVKAIRIYSSKLTVAQAQQNYKVDKKRFNLS